jgi:hypothetical protein
MNSYRLVILFKLLYASVQVPTILLITVCFRLINCTFEIFPIWFLKRLLFPVLLCSLVSVDPVTSDIQLAFYNTAILNTLHQIMICAASVRNDLESL